LALNSGVVAPGPLQLLVAGVAMKMHACMAPAGGSEQQLQLQTNQRINNPSSIIYQSTMFYAIGL